MKLENISSKVSGWFDASVQNSDVVISSRIRLARNLANHHFVSKCDISEKKCILDKLKTAILPVNTNSDKFYININESTQLQKELLVERQLVSKTLINNNGPRGAVINSNELFTAMINEEDHLRMQLILPGLQLQKCWDTINRIDDEIEEKVCYSFDRRLGYLTACPTNVGTGIRVSVMLHLPALKLSGQIEKLLNAARDMKLAVRGLFGEGTEAIGDFFQISNQITLGVREKDIVDKFSDIIIPKILEYELVARDSLISQNSNVLNDKIYRAEGILKNAHLISSQEALFLLSQIRLGVSLKKIKDLPIDVVNKLFMLTQPAHLQRNAGHALTPEERDRLRAKLIRSEIRSN